MRTARFTTHLTTREIPFHGAGSHRTVFPSATQPASRAHGDSLKGCESLPELRKIKILGPSVSEAIHCCDLLQAAGELPEGSVADNTAPAPDATEADLVLHVQKRLRFRAPGHDCLTCFLSSFGFRVTSNLNGATAPGQ